MKILFGILLLSIVTLCLPAHASGLVPAVNADMGCTGSSQQLYYNGSSITCGVMPLPQSVVGSLPTCNSAAKGIQYLATDLLTPVALGTATGGGAVIASVTCNGTAWIVS